MKNYTTLRFTNSKKEFYLFEIILFFVYLIPGFLAIYDKFNAEYLVLLLVFGLFLGFLFFVIEHSYHVIMNKEENSCKVIQKALFRNLYMVVDQLAVSDIKNASLFTSVRRKNKRTETTYGICLNLKNGSEIRPYGGHSTNRYTYWTNLVEDINAFLSDSSVYKEFHYRPCAFRIIGVIFSALYFYLCISELLTKF